MKSSKSIYWLFAGLFLAAIFIGITHGSVPLRITELFSASNRAILYVRALRVLLAIVAGGGLAVCGIVLQAVLRNPLADPYLLGTSSGAGLGAVVAVVSGISILYMPVAAFLGAVAAVAIVYAIAYERGTIDPRSLILAGVITSIAMSGIVVFVVSLSPSEAVHGLMWWLWGSLEVYDLHLLFAVTLLVTIGVGVVYFFSQDLDAISLGEEKAVHLGIDIEKTKLLLLALTALITASLVCVCGVIGFVGLIIPHLMRLIVGAGHKQLIPVSVLAAGAFMIVCDTLGRVLFAPVQIPIGVVTAIVGAPIFIILFKTRRGSR